MDAKTPSLMLTLLVRTNVISVLALVVIVTSVVVLLLLVVSMVLRVRIG